jgi:hypothetical protein
LGRGHHELGAIDALGHARVNRIGALHLLRSHLRPNIGASAKELGGKAALLNARRKQPMTRKDLARQPDASAGDPW